MSVPQVVHNHMVVNGANIHYIEKNSQSDKTLLFIHGRAMDVKCWQKQFSDETLSPFRLIAVDFPGHGLSDHSENSASYSITRFGAFVANFVNALKLDNYIAAGLSFGGNIISQTLPQLDKVKGVFSMTLPLPRPVDLSHIFKNTDVIAKAYSEEPGDDDIQNYLSILMSPGVQVPEITHSAFRSTDPLIHRGIADSLIARDYQDEIQIVRNAHCPVAIVLGQNEQVYNLDYLNNFDLPLWRQSYQIIPDAGHFLNWENATKVNELLVQFAADCFL